ARHEPLRGPFRRAACAAMSRSVQTSGRVRVHFIRRGGDWGREVMRLDNGFTMYGTGRGRPTLPMTKPYNGKAAVPGNRTMVAPVLQERSQVDALHAKARALGGTDAGAPVRGSEGPQAFCGAYFRDRKQAMCQQAMCRPDRAGKLSCLACRSTTRSVRVSEGPSATRVGVGWWRERTGNHPPDAGWNNA